MDPKTIWILFKGDREPEEPRRMFVAWWAEKPSVEAIMKAIPEGWFAENQARQIHIGGAAYYEADDVHFWMENVPEAVPAERLVRNWF